MRRFTRALVMAGLSLLAPLSPAVDEDHRAWQHGIDFVQVGSRLLLVWGSPGNPPKPVLGGDWQHDVYYAWIDSTSDAITPNILVSRPEAQEPPSTAINSLGTLLMTSEDGNGGINQHAGLWTSALDVVRKYPLTIRRGGHSGHVAAMRDRFLVVYGEGWVEGGGFLNRGTGKDVHARIVENDGTLRREVKLTEAGRAHRDGWPLVAGSDRNWLVVWQRYPGMTLESALIDTSGAVTSRKKLMDAMPVRYAYDVEYAKSLDSYIVAGTSGSKGFISLVSRRAKSWPVVGTCPRWPAKAAS